MDNMDKKIQFTTSQILYRVVLPFGSAAWAFSQFPATDAGNAFLALVVTVGLFVAFNQGLEALDRKLNRGLYEKGLA